MNQIILLITLIVSLINLYLQFQNNKLRKLEDENNSLKSNVLKALNAIQGYQNFIKEISFEKGITEQSLKRKIHTNYKASFFYTRFVEPGNIQELINKYGK